MEDDLEQDVSELLLHLEIGRYIRVSGRSRGRQLGNCLHQLVGLFDEMARQLPEGVYLTGMKQTGDRVEVRGIAQSSTRVSALMRQVDSSEWMTDPEVEKVETTQSGASRQAEFVVYLKQESPGSTEDL